jgi:hypothetical protein
MIEKEKTLEKKFSKIAKDLGGLSFKLPAVFCMGLPDRLCLLPGGLVFFAEIKSTGAKPTKIQNLMHDRIRALGFKVFIIDSTESLIDSFDNIIKE